MILPQMVFFHTVSPIFRADFMVSATAAHRGSSVKLAASHFNNNVTTKLEIIRRLNQRLGGSSSSIPSLTCGRAPQSDSHHQISTYSSAQPLCTRKSHRQNLLPAICAVLSGTEDIGLSSSQFDEVVPVTVSTSGANDAGEIKMNIEVSGAKTQAIFDQVFDKMVTAAQPIPGFRRVKGGKTPNIPRDILLEVLGPSKVYKQVIKKVINSTIAEYVKKEGLEVEKDLRVEQSFEDLEAAFEAGENFSFDAVIHLSK